MIQLITHLINTIKENDNCMIEFIFIQWGKHEFKYYLDKCVYNSEDNILNQLLKEYKLKSIKIIEYEH